MRTRWIGIILLLLAHPALADPFQEVREIADKLLLFKQYDALPLVVFRNEKLGDTYELPANRIIQQKMCFPQLAAGSFTAQTPSVQTKKNTYDVAGHIEASLPAVKAEIKGKVNLYEVVELRLSQLNVNSVEVSDLVQAIDTKSCPFLNGTDSAGVGRSYSVIRGLLHGDGYLSSDWNLEVSGSLSADALNALKQFIKTTFAADINGSIAHIDTQRWDYHRNIPFAYIPAFISATDLKEKMSLMDKGADKILASVETEAGYNDFFKNFPVVNREPSDEFNRTFAGSTIPFRPDKDIGQQEYFAFKSDLLRAQVTVYNKSYEPPVRGQD